MRRNVLPVKEHKDHILKLIAKHQVVCIEGGTGSGKSSMIPQFILEQAAFHSKKCKILVSQPNHITAIRLAQRVSRKQREDVGKTVGYGIHSELYEVSLSLTKIIYCTREYMLQVRCSVYICSVMLLNNHLWCLPLFSPCFANRRLWSTPISLLMKSTNAPLMLTSHYFWSGSLYLNLEMSESFSCQLPCKVTCSSSTFKKHLDLIR